MYEKKNIRKKIIFERTGPTDSCRINKFILFLLGKKIMQHSICIIRIYSLFYIIYYLKYMRNVTEKINAEF